MTRRSSRTPPGAPGALLVNLGTPDAPRTPEVRRYLREFLSDPYVLDMPAPGRFLLLYGIILPLRPARSAEAYRKIWTDRGSPLMVHSLDLLEAVRAELEPDTPVELAMRYGNPSIATGLRALRRRGVWHVTALPLYPQYAASTTDSVAVELAAAVAREDTAQDIVCLPPFYDDPGFIRAFADVGRPVLGSAKPDHVLMSYHGLPERQILKGDPGGAHCLKTESCCRAISSVNARCYRAQCYATSRLLAEALDLAPGEYTVSFQSRLGRTPWIRPYTDQMLAELARRGVRRLAVLCPSFVADCLETLEELGIRGREQFLAAGGEAFTLVPSLNAHPTWVRTVAGLLRAGVREGVHA
jgi:ferrochelatase